MTAHERIYLQGADDAPDCEAVDSGVTWCWHQIDSSDVEYVRADIAAAPTLPAVIYQVTEDDGLWSDTDWMTWASTGESSRRVVYAAPTLPAAQEEKPT